MKNFQLEVLKRKVHCFTSFWKYCAEKGIHFPCTVGGGIYDYCVLEYSFCVVAVGTEWITISAFVTDTDDEVFSIFLEISDLLISQKDSAVSFFVQYVS